MSAYTDEAFREAIEALRAGLARLARVRDAIDWQEPIRERVDEQLRVVDGALADLARVYEDATQELL